MKKRPAAKKDEVLTKAVFQEIWDEGMAMLTATFERVATKEDLKAVQKDIRAIQKDVAVIQKDIIIIKKDVAVIQETILNIQHDIARHERILDSILATTTLIDKLVHDAAKNTWRIENHEERIEKLELRASR